jgi:hypothetical protein
MLNDLRYEIRDVFPAYPDILHKFVSQDIRLSCEDLALILLDAGANENEIEAITNTLLWFSFLGVAHDEEARYSYQLGYNLPKLKNYIQSTNPQALVFEVHPAFRRALEIKDAN